MLPGTLLALPAHIEGDEPMQRGVVTQFQSEAGDRVFFAEGSNELGARAALDAQAVDCARTPLSPSPSRATPTIARDNLKIAHRQDAARRGLRQTVVQRSEPAQHLRAVSPLNARDLPGGTAARLSVIEKRRAGA